MPKNRTSPSKPTKPTGPLSIEEQTKLMKDMLAGNQAEKEHRKYCNELAVMMQNRWMAAKTMEERQEVEREVARLHALIPDLNVGAGGMIETDADHEADDFTDLEGEEV